MLKLQLALKQCDLPMAGSTKHLTQIVGAFVRPASSMGDSHWFGRDPIHVARGIESSHCELDRGMRTEFHYGLELRHITPQTVTGRAI